jgi:hypothetical protein
MAEIASEDLWSFPPERKRGRQVLGVLLVMLGTAYSVLAGFVIVESIQDTSSQIILFGRTLFVTTPTIETITIAGIALTLGGIITLAMSASARARRYKKMRTEVDRRWHELSVRHAGLEARHELLQWRIPELQKHVDTLHGKRDQLLEEMGRIAEKTRALRDLASESTDMLHQMNDNLLVLPESESSEPEPAEPV